MALSVRVERTPILSDFTQGNNLSAYQLAYERIKLIRFVHQTYIYRLTINVNLMKCMWHLCNEETNTKFCSVRCKNKFHVNKRRKKLKVMAVEYKGGKCSKCGYSRCIDAMEFHHSDPNKKDFGIAAMGYTRSWDSVKAELDKCILVCANCHREIHHDE